MFEKPKVSGSTIAYQLRHRKAIERNLFLTILKKLDRFLAIDIKDYRYVGFGAAFLEDFKALHSEFGIDKMDCIEMDEFAFSRQVFNNPYVFIKLYPVKSTDYITSQDFKQDLNQIIWWDFAEPKSIRQQLKDIELTAQKAIEYDILKFTFNAEINSFISSHKRGLFDKPNLPNYTKLLEFLRVDATYNLYLPETITEKMLEDDFPGVLRTMAIRAVNRGLSKSSKHFVFNHIASFTYSDGQLMTTITGVLSTKEIFKIIMEESSLNLWEFYISSGPSEIFPATHIEVPVMTMPERAEIDKMIHQLAPTEIATSLRFFYGTTKKEHFDFILGYCKFYRYLPYYSRVTF